MKQINSALTFRDIVTSSTLLEHRNTADKFSCRTCTNHSELCNSFCACTTCTSRRTCTNHTAKAT
uniref:Uncharacterized protein n=1 Tax=Arundo donax TaxID=35708 RepID=A0A0A9DLK5_ARUDO